MIDLYTAGDLESARSQLKKRLAVLLLLSAVFLAAFIYTLMIDNHRENRPEALSTVVLLLWGFAMIFGWDLFCRPVRCYIKHLQSALHGRVHEVSVIFDRAGEDLSVVDGVQYRDLVFLGEADKHGDRDRLFYWDAELENPPFRKGDQVLVRYYDRFMTGYQVL